MLSLVGPDADRLTARFLEPTCGTGNILVRLLERKLGEARRLAGTHQPLLHHTALVGLMNLYGIELLGDNVAECRTRLSATLASGLEIGQSHPTSHAARRVLDRNIVHGDTLTGLTARGTPIVFSEWIAHSIGRYTHAEIPLSAPHPFPTLQQSLTLAHLSNQEQHQAGEARP